MATSTDVRDEYAALDDLCSSGDPVEIDHYRMYRNCAVISQSWMMTSSPAMAGVNRRIG